MPDILIHTPVLARSDGEGHLSHVLVRGHAFGVTQVHVTIEGPGGAQIVDVIPDGRAHWLAIASDRTGGVPEAWTIGAHITVTAADADDLEGCYAKTQTRIQME